MQSTKKKRSLEILEWPNKTREWVVEAYEANKGRLNVGRLVCGAVQRSPVSFHGDLRAYIKMEAGLTSGLTGFSTDVFTYFLPLERSDDYKHVGRFLSLFSAERPLVKTSQPTSINECCRFVIGNSSQHDHRAM